MPLKNTLADALAPSSRICESLGISPSDPRAVGYINAASSRLFVSGKWIGTVDKATINVTSQLLTLPAQFATAEQIALNHEPLALRSPWFEFNPGGWGTLDDPQPGFLSFGASGALRRNGAPTFLDIPPGSAFPVRIVCDVSADVGAKVLIEGLDANANWVRTNPAGVWQNGESLAMAAGAGTTSTTHFSRVTGMQFAPGRSGQAWLYMVDGSPSGTIIGHYQYWESYPSYARYLLPFVPPSPPSQVDILGKLNFRPVSQPSDWLPIPNLEALRLACLAVKREEENFPDQAALFMNGKRDPRTGEVLADGAITILDKELGHFNGSGEVACFRTHGAVGPEGDPIEALL